MQIQLTLNLGTKEFPNHPFREGDVREVPDDFGVALVARGFAVVVPSELPDEIKGVPAPPKIAGQSRRKGGA